MRGRLVIASTLAAATAATAATAAVAVNAAQANQGTAGTAARQITVVERGVTDTVVDIGPSGDSRGDLLAFANPVYDNTNSTRVGHDQGSCIRTVVGKAWQCSWTTWVGNGSLVVEGPFYDHRDSVLAITGGTGAFSRARGEMHLHARNAKGTAFTFRFMLQN